MICNSQHPVKPCPAASVRQSACGHCSLKSKLSSKERRAPAADWQRPGLQWMTCAAACSAWPLSWLHAQVTHLLSPADCTSRDSACATGVINCIGWRNLYHQLVVAPMILLVQQACNHVQARATGECPSNGHASPMHCSSTKSLSPQQVMAVPSVCMRGSFFGKHAW